MGTRSLTRVFEKWEDTKGKKQRQPIVCMYRQYDGYISGHGHELAQFLEPFTIVNGIGLDNKRKIANGMGCLAAQLIAHFKDCPGNIYLYATDAKDCWQEYEYEIEKTKGKLILLYMEILNGMKKKISMNGNNYFMDLLNNYQNMQSVKKYKLLT